MRKNHAMYGGAAALLTAALLAGCSSAPADSIPASSAAETVESESTAVESEAATAETTVDLEKVFSDNTLENLLAKYETVTTSTQYTYPGSDAEDAVMTIQFTTKDGKLISHGENTDLDGNTGSSYATYADAAETGVYLLRSEEGNVVTVYADDDCYAEQSGMFFLPSASDAAYMTVTGTSEQDGAALIETETVVDGQRLSTGIYYVDPTTGDLLADCQTYYHDDEVIAEATTSYDYTTAYADTTDLYHNLMNVDGGRNITIVFPEKDIQRTVSVVADSSVGVISNDNELLYADVEGKELLYTVEPGVDDVTVYALSDNPSND